MRRFSVKRLTVLFLLGALAGCGSGAPPHSDYYVVTFLANVPAPSGPGLAALDHAVRQAGSHTPRFIALNCAAPASGDMPDLVQQRIAAITHAFVQGGVDPHLIRNVPHSYDAKALAERKDSVILQLAYGEAPN